MQLTYGFQVHPGHCHVCHTSQQGMKVIDTSADDLAQVRRYRVYVCEQCVRAMAKLVDPTKVVMEQEAVDNLVGENTALTNEVARLIAEAAALDTRLAKAMQS